MANNPLVSDRNVEFLLYEVFDVEALCGLQAYEEHSRETFDLLLQNARKFAREVILPTYRPVDEAPARMVGDGIKVHPAMQALYPKLAEQGMTAATRPASVGGQQLPHTVASSVRALRDGGEPERRQLPGPHGRRRAPHRGVRQRLAQGRDDDPHVQRPVDGDDGADRAAGRQQPDRRQDDAPRPRSTGTT